MESMAVDVILITMAATGIIIGIIKNKNPHDQLTLLSTISPPLHAAPRLPAGTFFAAILLYTFQPNYCFDGRPAVCAEDSEMGILIKGKACPKCKDGHRFRVKRSTWMRIIPGTKCYKCVDCDSKYLSVRESFSVSWPFGKAA